MAKKVVKNEVKTDTKKKGRRLKRSVRKTLGALFLATAIAVAAIPVDGLQAAPTEADDDHWGTLEENLKSMTGITGMGLSNDVYIPMLPQNSKIYTDKDSRYQFGYTMDGARAVAVLLGYTGGNLTNNALEIPEQVEAYANISPNLGSEAGLTAVSRNNDFLYYPTYTWRMEDVTGPDGTVTQRKVYSDPIFKPCYAESRDSWYYYGDEPGMPQGDVRALEDFYYYPNGVASGTPTLTGTDVLHQWMRSLDVYYIGNQTLRVKEQDASDGGASVTEWELGDPIDDVNRAGLLAGNGNIASLKVPATLKGIGDYAFYGCSGLQSITLGNGVFSIGVGAFADCGSLKTADFGTISNLQVIGDYAFYNCRGLQTFTLPINVRILGNSAFEKCTAMTVFDTRPKVDGTENAMQLRSIGSHAFRGCAALGSFYVPGMCEETISVCTFEGCNSLAYIEVETLNKTFNLEDTGAKCTMNHEYTFTNFINDVGSDFYIWGVEGDYGLHTTAKTNSIPFMFYSSYHEKYVYERSVTDNGKIATYQVDADNKLVGCDIPNDMENVTLPESIGPKRIVAIGASTFRDNCYITTITIPESILEIEAEAFMGCHNLEWVIFTKPNDNLTIGARAFWTQEAFCNDRKNLKDNTPVLHFVGPISYDSAPFQYAMTPSESIDNDDQPQTYITYHSGWPYLLEVRYNPANDENELVNYPTIKDLGDGKYSTGHPYLTDNQRANTQSAAEHFYGTSNNRFDLNALNDTNTDERDLILAALNLVLPKGIEGIEKDLFARKEGTVLSRTVSDGDVYGHEYANDGGKLRKTITAEGILGVDDYAFRGHESLVEITFSDMTVSVGYHAFEGCSLLESVSFPGTVQTMGERPFAGCPKLSTVNFNGGPYFTCENGIIFELSPSVKEKKEKVVELLESRTGTVTSDETEGVTALYKEAFMGTNVLSIDLSESEINRVPESAFAETPSLKIVVLPDSMEGGTIVDGAFRKSGLEVITIPGNYINMTTKAFEDVDSFDNGNLQIVSKPGGMAWNFASDNGLKTGEYKSTERYTVRFFYRDDNNERHQIGEDLKVEANSNAERLAPQFEDFPEEAKKSGYTFTGWFPLLTTINQNPFDTYAQFEQDAVVVTQYTVVFRDHNGITLSSQTVTKGDKAIVPQSPSRINETPPWIFEGWVLSGGNGEYLTQDSPELMSVQSDMVLLAQYRLAREGETVDPGTGATQSPNPGTSGSPSPGTSGSPSPGTSGSPSPGTSGSPSPGTSGSPSPGAGGTLYTLTVQNGSGSGSYVEGAQPVIIANDPATGQEFDYWSVSPDDVKIASTVLSASVITMPAKDVTVTAHYKAGSGNSTSGSGTTGSGNNAQRPNGNVESASTGTTVVIDKNGLSNTGVVSATVHGSSDNFTIKISDTAEAAEAALRALMAEYGDDLTNIRYFPMDISLYDSTGTYKITDTTGLSVDITLPLPDSMITYAGNNRAASTVGGRLERLDARFSTIQGVSCITFTAEHFSPYMIYVDLGNLSSGLVSDNTPQTGDGIHPKWFLSIGLACLSMVFFMQKDSGKRPKKAKVKVRAR